MKVFRIYYKLQANELSCSSNSALYKIVVAK